jgi:hypothetical protein
VLTVVGFIYQVGPKYIRVKYRGIMADFVHERIHVEQISLKQTEPQGVTYPRSASRKAPNMRVVRAQQSNQTSIESLVSASLSATVSVPGIFTKLFDFVGDMGV